MFKISEDIDGFPIGAKGRVDFSSTPFHKLEDAGMCITTDVSTSYAQDRLKLYAELKAKGNKDKMAKIISKFVITYEATDKQGHYGRYCTHIYRVK